MKKYFFLLITLILLISCTKSPMVDLIVYNAQVYTLNNQFEIAEAFAIKDGRFIEIGTTENILSSYQAMDSIDAEQLYVFPGFYDAHCHFYGYGLMKIIQADLSGTQSFAEVLDLLIKHDKSYPSEWVRGRGWDQNDWEVKEFPTREELDKLFPDKPVYISRIDGHAALVNSKALEIAGVTVEMKIPGGDLIKKDGKLTGVLIDNAMDLVYGIIPVPTDNEVETALMKAQEDCFSVGLSSVADAGLSYELVQTIDQLQKSGDLKIRVYAMLNPEEKNLNEYVKNGPVISEQLNIRSIKLYADGALGSRGAKLIEPYHDDPSSNGLLIKDENYFRKICQLAIDNNYQVNTHAIGDSANRMLLNIYGEFVGEENDKRWRIEHAQVIHPDDFSMFGKYHIIPSVQPTHATSDMYWADERLGDIRLASAYAYKQLLNENGWLPLGTDFPVEQIDPLLTFYAAVSRKDVKGFPEGGFQMENALSREEALKGMTIWAAKASFDENIKGSIESGKLADFVILDKNIMKIIPEEILNTRVKATYVGGEVVFEQ